MYSLIVTAKQNDVDPRAWLADVLARIRPSRIPAARVAALALENRTGPADRCRLISYQPRPRPDAYAKGLEAALTDYLLIKTAPDCGVVTSISPCIERPSTHDRVDEGGLVGRWI